MGDEVRVLGRFTPSEFSPDVVEQEFRKLSCLPLCCRSERVSVRVPMGIVPPADNLQWHQDGGGPLGTTHHMVVWASENPTHLKTSAGERVPTDAGDVIWFDNTLAWHRQPNNTDETTRWFISVRCSGVPL